MLNQEKITSAGPAEGNDPIVVEGPRILITRRMSVIDEMAALIVGAAPVGARPEVMRRLLHAGAEAESLYNANLTLQQFERRVQGMQESFGRELNEILRAGGDSVEERLIRALHKHERDLVT